MPENIGDNTLKCPYCFEMMDEISASCSNCGGDLFQCPECEILIKDEDNVCPSCGSSFEEETQEDNIENPVTPVAALVVEPVTVIAQPKPVSADKKNAYVMYINTMKEVRNEDEGHISEIQSKLYYPRIGFIQTILVLLFLMTALGFILQFTILKDFWYAHFTSYNLYLMLVTAAGIGLALYAIVISEPETSQSTHDDKKRGLIGIIGLIMVLAGFILLLLFRNDPQPMILILNIMILYGIFTILQMSRTIPKVEAKKLFIVFTGIALIIAVPLHEAFGPFQTGFQTLPWNLGNEILLVIGMGLFIFGFTTIKNSTSFLAIWLSGLMILFVIPFHESAGIISSGNYEPWDHTLAIIGIVVCVAGGSALLARKHRFGSIAKYLTLGNDRFGVGDYEGALENYEQAMEIASNARVAYHLSTPWHSIADAHANLGREEEALANYVTALKINPEDEIAWANKGSCLAQMNRRAEGLKCYNRSVELNPGSYSVWTAKGLLETSMGRLEDAIISYENAKKIDRERKETWIRQAESYGLMGKYENAIANIEKAIEIDPNDQDLPLLKARIYYSAGYNREAVIHLKKILEEDPSSKWALVETANILFHQQEYTNAKTTLERIPSEERLDRRIAILEGKTLLALEDHLGASQVLEHSMKIHGETKDLLVVLAEAKDTPNTKKEAIDIHRKIVKRARGQLDHEQIKRALECYSNAINIGQDVKNAHKGSAEAFLKLQRYHDALGSADQAIENDGIDVDIRMMKGISLMKLHRYVEAMDCLNESLKIDTTNVELWFNKGNTQASMNKFDNAIESYNAALHLDPKHMPSIINRNMCIRSKIFNNMVN